MLRLKLKVLKKFEIKLIKIFLKTNTFFYELNTIKHDQDGNLDKPYVYMYLFIDFNCQQ